MSAASTRPSAEPFDSTLGRGLVALLCLINRDGHNPESLTPACVHLVVRLIAAESAVLVRSYGGPALQAVGSADTGGSAPAYAPAAASAVTATATDPKSKLECEIVAVLARAFELQRTASSGPDDRSPSFGEGLASLAAGWLPRRPGGGRSAAAGDAALLLLHFMTGMPKSTDEPGAANDASTSETLPQQESERFDATAPEAQAAVGAALQRQERVSDAALHIQGTRLAVASSLGGQGIALLALRLAAATWALRAFLAEPALPLPLYSATTGSSAGTLAAPPRAPSAALAWVESFPPRYQCAFAELRLLLALFEDITFSADGAVQRGTDARIPSSLMFRKGQGIEATAARGTSAAGCDASAAGRDASVVELLLTCVEWLLSNAPATINAAAPLLALFHGFLRVLVNLTNHHAAGCAAVLSASRIEPPVAAATPPAALLDIAGLPWGLSIVIRTVILARSAVDAAVAPVCSGSAVAPQTSNAGFDTLVLGLGLLTNCLEHDPDARSALAAGSFRVGALPAADEARVRSLLVQCQAGGKQSTTSFAASAASASVLALLCDVFCERYVRLGLHSSDDDSPGVAPVQGPTAGTDDESPGDLGGSADDVVVAAYAGMAICCCMLRHEENQRTVLSMIGPAVDSSACATAPLATAATCVVRPVLHPGLVALKRVLRVFVALQTSAGVLTDDSLQHILAVEGLLDHIQNSSVASVPSERVFFPAPSQDAADAGHPGSARDLASPVRRRNDEWLWAPSPDARGAATERAPASTWHPPALVAHDSRPVDCIGGGEIQSTAIDSGDEAGNQGTAAVGTHDAGRRASPGHESEVSAHPSSGGPDTHAVFARKGDRLASLAEQLARRVSSGVDCAEYPVRVSQSVEVSLSVREIADECDSGKDKLYARHRGCAGSAPPGATPGVHSLRAGQTEASFVTGNATSLSSSLHPSAVGVGKISFAAESDSKMATVNRAQIDVFDTGLAAAAARPVVRAMYGSGIRKGLGSNAASASGAVSASDFIFADD